MRGYGVMTKERYRGSIYGYLFIFYYSIVTFLSILNNVSVPSLLS